MCVIYWVGEIKMIKYECFVQQKEVTSHECWTCFKNLNPATRPDSKLLCQQENAIKIDGDSF